MARFQAGKRRYERRPGSRLFKARQPQRGSLEDQQLPGESSDTESPSDDENEDEMPPLSQEELDLLCG